MSNRVAAALVAGGVMLGMFAAYAAGTSVSRVAAPPTAVCVVRLNAVLDGLNERLELEKRVERDIDNRKAQLNEIKTRLDELREQLQTVETPATPSYLDRLREANELDATLRVRGEIFTQTTDAEKAAIFADLFFKIRDSAKSVAEREGYDIVLIDDSDQGFAVPTQAGVISDIQSRSVLYASERVDITSLVQSFMNNKFQTGG